jgi:hypothetical protein
MVPKRWVDFQIHICTLSSHQEIMLSDLQGELSLLILLHQLPP